MVRATLNQRDMTAIEVFADVTCPFTHVGLRRLVDLRTQLGRPDVHLRVRAWPLEIVNGQPLDPDFIAEEVDDIRGQVAPDLFEGFAQPRSRAPRSPPWRWPLRRTNATSLPVSG